VNLRIHDYFERGKKVKIIVNDETIEAYEGECLSVVLFISNKKNLRTSPKLKENRGMFCMMGSCQECVVLLNGKKVTSCNIFIKDGMEIKTGNLNEF
jgi:predicted molibdopterin-dependent oxidoreductase YjgC